MVCELAIILCVLCFMISAQILIANDLWYGETQAMDRRKSVQLYSLSADLGDPQVRLQHLQMHGPLSRSPLRIELLFFRTL